MPASIAKGGSARWVYVPESLVGEAITYAVIDRPDVIKAAQAAGRYRRWPRAFIVEDPDRPVARSSEGSRIKVAHLDPDERRRLFIDGPGGLEPAGFWLTDTGDPVSKSGWKEIFRAAASAHNVWSTLLRFMRFLAALPEPPATVSALTVQHLDSFREHRMARVGDPAWMEFRSIALLMRNQVISDLLAAEARDHLSRRQDQWRLRTKPGYSDRGLNALVRAARADVDAIRQRIRTGWDQVTRHR